MRVLLTGNEGYIGTLLVPLLWARGHEVVGLDSGLFRECTLKAIRPVEKTIRKDIRDVEPRDLDGIDAVIHLAGLSNDPLGDLSAALTYEINHEATVRLAEIAKRAGIRRFLYASTCSVYGAAGDEMLDEDSPANPVTPYAESKARAERDLRPLADRDVLPGLPARRDRLRRIAAAALRPRGQQSGRLGGDHRAGVPQEPAAPHGGRSCTSRTSRSPYITLLHAPGAKVHNRAFNIGRTEENYRIRDVAEIVRRTVPKTTVEFAAGRLARSAQLPGELRPHRARAARHTGRTGRCAQGVEEVYRGDPGMGAAARGLRGPALQPDRLFAATARRRRESPTISAGSSCTDAAADSSRDGRPWQSYRKETSCRVLWRRAICSPILGFGATPLADRLLTEKHWQAGRRRPARP